MAPLLWLVFCFFRHLVTPIPSCYIEEDQASCVKPETEKIEGVKKDERVTGKEDREGEGW